MMWLAVPEESSMGLEGIGSFWPLLLTMMKVMGVGLLCAPMLIAICASKARRKAYGPGGGRR